MNASQIAKNRNNPAPFYVAKTPIAPNVPDESGTPSMSSRVPEEAPIQTFNDDQSKGALPPAEPEATATAPEYNPAAPHEATSHAEMMKNAAMMPVMSAIEANRAKAAAIRNMPVTDKDGRTRSGLQAFIESLARNPQLRNVRSWGDLAKAGIYSAGVGIGGAVDKTWNERQKRDIELARIEEDTARLQKQAEADLKMANQASVIQNRERTANRQDAAFENRVNQQKYKQVRDEKKDVLAPIFKRGFFYQDSASPEELQRLEAAGIVLDDFDTTKTAYTDENGVRKVWDVRKREYVQAAGDEAEPMVETEIDGVRIRLKPSEFANYKAQEGRINYQTAKDDADNEQKYNDDFRRWQTDEDKRNQDNIKLSNDANAKAQEAESEDKTAEALEKQAADIAEDDPAKAADLRRDAQKSRGKANNLRSEANGLLNRATNSKAAPQPVRQKKLPTYNSGVKTVGKYSGKTFSSPSAMRAAFPGKSDEEIKQIVEANGGAFSQ